MHIVDSNVERWNGTCAHKLCGLRAVQLPSIANHSPRTTERPPKPAQSLPSHCSLIHHSLSLQVCQDYDPERNGIVNSLNSCFPNSTTLHCPLDDAREWRAMETAGSSGMAVHPAAEESQTGLQRCASNTRRPCRRLATALAPSTPAPRAQCPQHFCLPFPRGAPAGALLDQRDLIGNWDEFSQKNGKGLQGWSEESMASVCSWSTVSCVDGQVATL